MTTRIPRPCLDCGALTTAGNRCETDEAIRKQKKYRRDDANLERQARKRLLYDAEYQKQAAIVRKNAQTCHICGQGARPGDPWQADHVIPNNRNSILLPAHRSCNARRGNKPLT